jgi:hypothetical protein
MRLVMSPNTVLHASFVTILGASFWRLALPRLPAPELRGGLSDASRKASNNSGGSEVLRRAASARRPIANGGPPVCRVEVFFHKEAFLILLSKNSPRNQRCGLKQPTALSLNTGLVYREEKAKR